MSKKVNGWIWRIVCTAIGLIFGAGVAWGVMRTQVKGLDRAVSNHEERLRNVEEFVPRVDEKLANIEDDIKEIKEVLK